MELAEGILARRSIRAFRPEPVSQEDLRRVLELGTRAISANNSQPWQFAVVTGEVLEQLRDHARRALAEGRAPDREEDGYPEPYLSRGKENGRRLFAAMGIQRGDRERRAWWAERGFRFFDAPALILVYMDRCLEGTAAWFDLGCVTQNICLAALELGLGTCVEEQAVTFQNGLMDILDLPASAKLAYGIAIGYPDWDFPANQVVSRREPVDDLTRWYGF